MLFKNARILDGSQVIKVDIRVEEEKIVAIESHLFPIENEQVIDLKEKHVFPGFVDVHVHWRQPGFEYKETIASGSRAAARGGFTVAMPMPNLNPVPDNRQHLEQQLAIIKKDAVIHTYPYASITINEAGNEISDMDDLAKLPIAGFTDDGVGVQTANIMFEAMKKASKNQRLIVAHCEDNSLIRGGCMHDGQRAKELGLPGIPNVCEAVQVARDALLAQATNCHYHVCHVSAKETVQAIRDAKKNGIKITAEVCPHHLISCEDDISENNGLWKMNPPLRSREDQEALIEALEDGTIDFIATDHAPHAVDEKECDMLSAKFGIVGSETAFAQLYTHFVKTGKWQLAQLIDWLTIKPAHVFGIADNHGQLAIGRWADFTVINLDYAWQINPQEFVSMGRNTPYNGQKVYGMPALTICKGEIVWLDKNQMTV